MSREVAEERTREALEASGFEDMRPALRDLMRRLKQTDADSFRAAAERFENELVPAVASGEAAPLPAWAEYGAWLASRTGAGRFVLLDETGLATRSEPEAVPGHVLLFLPDRSGDPAIPILRPAELSPAQTATLEILTR